MIMDLNGIENYLCDNDKDPSECNIFWLIGSNKQKKDQFIDSLKTSLTYRMSLYDNNIITKDTQLLGEVNPIAYTMENKRVLLFRNLKNFSNVDWGILKVLSGDDSIYIKNQFDLYKIIKLECSILIESDSDPSQFLSEKMKNRIQIINMDQL